MSKTVVFCEGAAHVAEARSRAPEAHIVALTPAAAWACQCQGVPYLKLDDFYSDSDLNGFAEQVTCAQYGWAQWVDQWLAEAVEDFGKARFFPARWQLFLLKRRLDGLLLASWALTRFVATFRPDKLIVFARQPFIPDLDKATGARPLHALVAPAAEFPDCKVEVRPSDHHEPAILPYPHKSPIDLHIGQIGFKRRAKVIAKRLPAPIGSVLARVRRHWLGGLSFRHGEAASASRVAWIGGEDDLAWVAPHLRRLGVSLCRRVDLAALGRRFPEETRRMESVLQQAWDELRTRPEFWTFFDLQSPALCQLIEPFFHQWVTQRVPQTWGECLAAREWLSQDRIDLVMASALYRVVHSSVFGVAAGLGIPRVLYLHNPPGGPIDLPAQDAQDQIQADYYLVGGEGDVSYFRTFDARYGVFPRATPIAVGSARLDALRQAPPSAKVMRHLRGAMVTEPPRPLILYVPTVLNGAYRYFNEGSFSDVAYIELLQRVLGIFAEYPVSLLYKPFPGGLDFNPILDFLARRVSNARAVRGDWPLAALMWAADAIVVDFPSTAIAEVLLTDKPVLCYAGREWARLSLEGRNALAKRALVSETPDEFEGQLRDFLRRGDFRPVSSPDGEFLRLYATHLNDGRSANRAAEIIAGLAVARRAGRAAQAVSVVAS